MDLYTVKSAIMGAIVGDALGVPYEFKLPYQINMEEVKEFKGFGTHKVPPGFWSDDSSMILATLDGLKNGYKPEKVGKNFIRWLYYGCYTPNGKVFDIGRTTRNAIYQLKDGNYNGLNSLIDCGNGSLMRMLPIALYLYENPNEDILQIVKNASSLTHSHPQCIIGCYMYVRFAMALLKGENKIEAFDTARVATFNTFYPKNHDEIEAIEPYNHVICDLIFTDDKENVKSSGYIVETLEATIWCFMNSNSYDESVLKAISLGNDTDTIACLVGGLSGILYGYDSINIDWIDKIVEKDFIYRLCEKYARS